MKINKWILSIICVIVLAILGISGYWFVRHEKWQSNTIHESYKSINQNKTEQDTAIEALDERLTANKAEQNAAIKSLEENLAANKTEQTTAIKTLEENLAANKTEQATAVKTLEENLAANKAEYDKAIYELSEKVNQMEAMQSIMKKDDSYEYKFSCLYEDTFNVLVIGNSITVHPRKEYWWAERGMAASTDDKDYVHLIEAELLKQHDKVNLKAVQFRSWEIQFIDRQDEYRLIDRYLNENIHWIIVQLGENVTDLTTYETDYISLLLHLHETVPDAKILTIGNFWGDKTKDAIKKRVAEGLGIAYVDLDEIQNNPEYQSKLGTVIIGEDGKKHLVDNEGVASHPNDLGMQYIADKVMECIHQFGD